LRFQLVSPLGPKKSARMLLSTPVTANSMRSKNVTASEPIKPLLPVTRTCMGYDSERASTEQGEPSS
jgi:hypothetical protein